jgi:peptide/nickel transport system permease protein
VTGFVLRRLGQAVIVVFGVTLIVFLLVHLLPGSPAQAFLGPGATQVEIHQFTIENGYNLPAFTQYADYIGRLFHGNLGFSYTYNQSVASLLQQDIPKTAILVGLSYVCTMLIAVPVGIVQAIRSNTLADHAITGASFVAYSMPQFWLGTLLILWFSVSLHIFPSEGPQGGSVAHALADPRALVLPVATLTLVSVAMFSRFVRSSAMTVLVQDYIRTARGKGIPLWRLIRKHVLRNVLGPMVTLFGVSLPFVIGGAIVVESVYNYPGMGLLLWKAATSRDYPLLMGITLVVGIATVVGNLLADILYAAVDPRVRYE